MKVRIIVRKASLPWSTIVRDYEVDEDELWGELKELMVSLNEELIVEYKESAKTLDVLIYDDYVE